MVKLEIDVPEEVWRFLEIAARFARAESEKYIRAYIKESIILHVESDVNDISQSHLWYKEPICKGYDVDVENP